MRKIFYLTLTTMLLSSCGSDTIKNLVFSIEDEKQLGLQTSQQIEASADFKPILSEGDNAAAYAYLNAMKNDILNSEDVKYKDEFVWQLKIIDQDVLNAFATPGGYIYVYTGLIKFLDNADDLAGVMGHEIAHADRRHSTSQLIQNQGVATIISIVTGGDSQLIAGLASQLLALNFSRKDESDADDFSVQYLEETDFACNGAATFFEKISAAGGSGGPEFLSTHPSPDNRVEDINAAAVKLGCDTTNSTATINGLSYAEFKALF